MTVAPITTFTKAEIAELLAHRSCPLDCFDAPLPEQLAVVEACDVFLAPHTGFGMAALAVGTPWLALSGGRWFEYFFNRVPFRSIIPDPERYPSFTQFALGVRDPERYPSFTQFALAPVVQDSGGEPRTLEHDAHAHRTGPRPDCCCGARAARRLGQPTSSACATTSPRLVAAQGGDAGAIWSIDGVHLAYV